MFGEVDDVTLGVFYGVLSSWQDVVSWLLGRSMSKCLYVVATVFHTIPCVIRRLQRSVLCVTGTLLRGY